VIGLQVRINAALFCPILLILGILNSSARTTGAAAFPSSNREP